MQTEFTSVNVLKPIESYILNGWVLQYVGYQKKKKSQLLQSFMLKLGHDWEEQGSSTLEWGHMGNFWWRVPTPNSPKPLPSAEALLSPHSEEVSLPLSLPMWGLARDCWLLLGPTSTIDPFSVLSTVNDELTQAHGFKCHLHDDDANL